MKKLSTSLFIAMLSMNTFASTYNVTNTNSSGAGSLKEAIMNANSDQAAPHTILASGISGTITLDSTLIIKRSMTIAGPTQGGLNLSGNSAFRILEIQSNISVQLQNLGFQNGQINFGGAAISSLGTTTISNCTFSDNKIIGGTGQGGAIWSNGGPLTISASTFSGNVSSQNTGGAIALYGSGNFTNCTFYGNSSNEGGAVYNYGTTGTFINCTFTGNTPNAISTDDASTKLFLVNDIITGNTSSEVSGKMAAQNCIFGDVSVANITSGSNNQFSISANQVFGNASLANNGGLTQTISILKPGPAANTGTSGTGVPSLDQRGETRDSQVDIGAYEETQDISAADEDAAFGNYFQITTLSALGKYQIEIKKENPNLMEWSIVDQQGKTLKKESPQSSTFEIDLSTYNRGIYFLTLTSPKERFAKRLFKY